MKNFIFVIFLLCIFLPSIVFAVEKPRTIHVFVGLCDNIHQNIIPVPPLLGNGEKPGENFYWGALYGVRSFFERSPDWKLVKTFEHPQKFVLERSVFKKKDKEIYLIADAYHGAKIKTAITHLLQSGDGTLNNTVSLEYRTLGIHGNADLLAYVGHNGLMDFNLSDLELKKSTSRKDIMILSYNSESYFEPLFEKIDATPLLLTTTHMVPEAYSLKAAIDGWVNKEDCKDIRRRAAKAYQKYQNIGYVAAKSVFSGCTNESNQAIGVYSR